jgi:pimeloyl-ACP methyl ester carboxylesterase
MAFIDANGVTFHYLQAGAGPDMILLHGLSGNLAAWHLRLVPMLQDRLRLTTYDLRGHGYSSMPPTNYSTRDMAVDLRALMDAWGIAKADLLGHSFGADIALHFAVLFPERVGRLVLIEPGIPALLTDRQSAEWEGWGNWASVLERLSGEPVPADKRNDVGYLLRRSVQIPVMYGPARGLPRRKDRILRILESTTMAADYERIDELTVDNLRLVAHPKLMIYDAGSAWLSTYKVLKHVLTDCTSVLLPKSDLGHFAPLDTPEQLVQALEAFLAGRPPVGVVATVDGADAS